MWLLYVVPGWVLFATVEITSEISHAFSLYNELSTRLCRNSFIFICTLTTRS